MMACEYGPMGRAALSVTTGCLIERLRTRF